MKKNELKKEFDLLNYKVDQLTYLVTSNFAEKETEKVKTDSWYVIFLFALLFGVYGYLDPKGGDKDDGIQ